MNACNLSQINCINTKITSVLNEKKGVKCINCVLSKKNLTILSTMTYLAYVPYLDVQGHPIEVINNNLFAIFVISPWYELEVQYCCPLYSINSDGFTKRGAWCKKSKGDHTI